MTAEEIQQCKEELNQIERNLVEITSIRIKPETEEKDNLFLKHKERLKNMDPYLIQFVDPDILALYQ